MQITGWALLVIGLALGIYGKYFLEPPYRVYGIVVAMAGASLLLWRPGRPADRN